MKRLRLQSIIGCMMFALLTGCTFPSQGASTATPNANEVATQVQQFLTRIPAQTQLPVQGTAALAATQALPSATPTVAETAVPTSTPTPLLASSPTAPVSEQLSVTPGLGDPKTTLGKPTRADNFETAQNWGLYSDEHVKVSAGAGYLSLTAVNPDGWHGWTLSSPALTDFYLEVTATPGACEGMDSYGAMVRAPDASHGYFFEVSCDGRFRFDKWDGSNFVDLIPWKRAAAINTGAGQTNRLGIMAKGSQFSLYVNGNLVGQIEDTTYGSGVFGLSIAAYKTPDFTVKVSEVDYWNLSS